MRLKPIYRYLGGWDEVLTARAIARCPSCCPPDTPPIPSPPLEQSPVVEEATIFGDKQDIVRLSDTDFVVVTGKGFLPNLQVGMVLYRYDYGTGVLTQVVKQTKLTALLQIFKIRALPFSNNKFVLYTESSAGGHQVRFVDVADSGFTEGSPTTLTFSASYTHADADALDSGRALFSAQRPLNVPEFFVLDYTDGSTFTQAATVAGPSAGSSPTPVVYAQDASTVFYNMQSIQGYLSVSPTNVITAGGTLNAASSLFTGGDLHIGRFVDAVIASNTRQVLVYTATNPPVFLKHYNATDRGLGQWSNNALNTRSYHSTPIGKRYHINRYDDGGSIFRPYVQELRLGDSVIEEVGTKTRLMDTEVFTAGVRSTASLKISNNTYAVAIHEVTTARLLTQVVTLP